MIGNTNTFATVPGFRGSQTRGAYAPGFRSSLVSGPSSLGLRRSFGSFGGART